MNKLSKNILWAVIIVLVIGGFLFWQDGKQADVQKLPVVRIGLGTTPYSSLVKIAIDKNFFSEEGVAVEVKEFTAGKFALQALVGGSLDLVTAAEFPIALAILNGEQLSIVSVINGTPGGIPMILRKDSDAFDPQKYFSKKRKIGTLIGAGVEFFVAEFFKKYAVQPSQYEIVSMRPEDMPFAFAGGNLDGIAIFNPAAYFAVEKVGAENVFSIKSEDLYSEIIVLSGKSDWIVRNEVVVEKVLRALKKSEALVKNNPEEAMGIVSAFTKLDMETMRSIWPTLRSQLGLDGNLVLTMQKEAQWAKDTGKIRSDIVIPNFRENVFAAPLSKVSPAVVDL